MKITKQRLKQIIREELENVLLSDGIEGLGAPDSQMLKRLRDRRTSIPKKGCQTKGHGKKTVNENH